METVNSDYLDSIADTLYTDQSRTVFLSDGTGGIYFDDAFRDQKYGEYGFSYWERRLLAGWEVADENGIDMADAPLHCIVHPLFIQRHFANGFVETIEMPFRRTGMVISFDPVDGNGLLFRPVFDFRRLDREETGEYRSRWDSQKRVLTVARKDDDKRWLAISCPEKVSYRSQSLKRRITYRNAELIGSPGVTSAYSPGEFLTTENRTITFTFGFGNSEANAAASSVNMRDSLVFWRNKRLTQTLQILDRVFVRCDNWEFEKAFAWSRLILSQLVVVRDDQPYLMTGIPFSPYPDGWHTCMSIPSLTACGFPPGEVSGLLETVVDNQNIDPASNRYGMFPGAMREDSVEYRIPEIAGLAALALNRIKLHEVEHDSIRDRKLYSAMLKGIEGTARYRIKNGLVTCEGNEHFLWDGNDAPVRPGALIESQALFGAVRKALLSYPFLDNISDGIPGSIITGSGGMKLITASSPMVVVGKTGTYHTPADAKTAMQFFYDPKERRWADRYSSADSVSATTDEESRIIFDDRISSMLSVYWFKPRDSRLISNAFHHAKEVGLIGEAGFRSVAENSGEYQPFHLYLSETQPRGTKSKGDVLLWSTGVLADMLAVMGNWDEVGILAESLVTRAVKQGVTGALHEAEDGDTGSDRPNVVGNQVHLTSTAEWVRLACEILIGLDAGNGPYLSMRPRIPLKWGDFEVTTKRSNGTIRLRRTDSHRWLVYQIGIKPYLQLALETYPEPGERALASLRVYPGGEAEIEFVRDGDGSWKTSVKRE